MSSIANIEVPLAATQLAAARSAVDRLTLKSRAYTAYTVRTTFKADGGDSVAAAESIEALRRFSEFVALDTELRRVFQGECGSFVALPARTILKRSQFDEATIESRRIQLQIYLQFLLKKGFVARSEALRTFLGLEGQHERDTSVLSEEEDNESYNNSSSSNNDNNSSNAKSSALAGHVACAAPAAAEDVADDEWIAADVHLQHNMKAAIQSVFVGLGPAQKVYITPEIPLEKFKAAKNACAMPVDEQPVVLIDLSRLGAAHQALLICTRGIYFRYEGLPASTGLGAFSYPELFRETLKATENELHIGPTKIVYLKYAGVRPKLLLELLLSLREYVKAKQLALKAAGSAASGTPSTPIGSAISSGSLPSVVGHLSPRPPDAIPLVLRAVRFLKARAQGGDGLEASDVTATWATVLGAAFREMSEANSVFKQGAIPAEKLNNACKSIELQPDEMPPLLFIDNTKHGSGYQAVIVTHRRWCFYSDRVEGGSGEASWEEILTHPMQQLDKHNVRIGSTNDDGKNKVINLAGAALLPTQLLECVHLLHVELENLGSALQSAN